MAELAVGLAGFGGVAAAFGGRERQFSAAEGTRLGALYTHAALALVGSLFTMVLLWFDLDLSVASYWAALVGLGGQLPAALYFTRRAYQFLRDPEMSTGPGAFALTATPVWSASVMFLCGIVEGGSMGFLFAGLSCQIGMGLWVFVRVLTLRN